MAEDDRTTRFRAERRNQVARRAAIIRDTQAEIFRLLDLAEQQIKTRIANAPTDWETFFLPQLQSQIRAAMSTFASEAGPATAGSASTAWQAGIHLVDKPIAAGGIQIAAYLPAIDTRQLVAMQAFQTSLMSDIGTTLANRINAELGLVAIGSQLQSQAITQIEGHLKTGGRSRATTILRTELGRVYATATQERMSQATKRLPGLQKEWRRSGKVHSRPAHNAMNGQRVGVNERFVIPFSGVHLRYPRDPNAPAAETINCGCESLPWMASWEKADTPNAA